MAALGAEHAAVAGLGTGLDRQQVGVWLIGHGYQPLKAGSLLTWPPLPAPFVYFGLLSS